MSHIAKVDAAHGDELYGRPSMYTLDLISPQSRLEDKMSGIKDNGRPRSLSVDCQFLPRVNTVDNDSAGVNLESRLSTMAAHIYQDAAAEYGPVEPYSVSSNDVEQLPTIPQTTKAPFRKWVQTFHRRRHIKRQRAASLTRLTTGLKSPLQSTDSSFGPGFSEDYHFSSSASSFAFVSAAREASLSLASMSLKDPSWRQTQRSSKGLSRTDRSSRASYSIRQSEDSQLCNAKQQQPIDPSVHQRSRHRRQVIEELIKTEEGYICDIRFLMSAYLTILASSHKAEVVLRSCISHSLTDIVQLHEEILEDLHKLVPDADHMQERPATADGFVPGRHHRWQSLDAVPEHRTEVLRQQQSPAMTAEPSIAADVAKVFTKKMNRFFVYEEYGAQYYATTKDLEAAFKSMSNWETNQKGLENLAHCLDSARDATASRKAMAISDLLAKPIQRVCRYPLLFAELLKCTPVYDSPEAHLEIENTLGRLREVTSAMNQATNDTRVPVEKTKLLQDRLVFSNQKPDALAKSRIRAFGQIQLCGVLHICWQTKTSVEGKYMICLLYRNWLCLAVAEKTDRQYTIEACFPLNGCSIEETDNRRAPFAWKVVFECNSQLYEITMSACSPKEEWEWRDRLSRRIEDYTCTQPDVSDTAFLALDVKSFGAILEKPGTVARQLSIRRAATVGSKSQLCQVIIQNTSVEKDATVTSSEKVCINRSRSVQNNSRIPVLAPSRSERARLEALVSDVWTRDVLPFPGISARARRERHVRSSASSLMQRISASSLASTFGKRSIGRAGFHKTELPTLSHAFPPASGTTDENVAVDEEQAATGGHDEKDTQCPVVRAVSPQIDPTPELPWQEHTAERSREWWKRNRSLEHAEQKESNADILAGRKARHDTTPRHNASDASQLTGSLRRTLARIFEESKRYECEAEETRDVFDDKGRGDMANDSTASLARQAVKRPGALAESIRCASVASSSTDVSRLSTLLSTQTSALEALAPLTRQKRQASPAGSCAKRPVLLRGSIRKSFRNLVH